MALNSVDAARERRAYFLAKAAEAEEEANRTQDMARESWLRIAKTWRTLAEQR